jgi:hypothetical protein
MKTPLPSVGRERAVGGKAAQLPLQPFPPTLPTRWVERAGERRRRFYRLTPRGERVLEAEREQWSEFVAAVARITRIRHA